MAVSSPGPRALRTRLGYTQWQGQERSFQVHETRLPLLVLRVSRGLQNPGSNMAFLVGPPGKGGAWPGPAACALTDLCFLMSRINISQRAFLIQSERRLRVCPAGDTLSSAVAEAPAQTVPQTRALLTGAFAGRRGGRAALEACFLDLLLEPCSQGLTVSTRRSLWAGGRAEET